MTSLLRAGIALALPVGVIFLGVHLMNRVSKRDLVTRRGQQLLDKNDRKPLNQRGSGYNSAGVSKHWSIFDSKEDKDAEALKARQSEELFLQMDLVFLTVLRSEFSGQPPARLGWTGPAIFPGLAGRADCHYRGGGLDREPGPTQPASGLRGGWCGITEERVDSIVQPCHHDQANFLFWHRLVDHRSRGMSGHQRPIAQLNLKNTGASECWNWFSCRPEIEAVPGSDEA